MGPKTYKVDEHQGGKRKGLRLVWRGREPDGDLKAGPVAYDGLK